MTDSSGWSLYLGTGKPHARGGASERWPHGANAVSPGSCMIFMMFLYPTGTKNNFAQSKGKVMLMDRMSSDLFTFCNFFS